MKRSTSGPTSMLLMVLRQNGRKLQLSGRGRQQGLFCSLYNGLYLCPRRECGVQLRLRSMRLHVSACEKLPEQVRRQRAVQREQRGQKQQESRQARPEVMRRRPASRRQPAVAVAPPEGSQRAQPPPVAG